MMLTLRTYTRQEITREAIAYIIAELDNGICVANGRGWVLETNPAFNRLCETLGIQPFEQIEQFNRALETLSQSGRVTITPHMNSRSLRTADGDYLLLENSFRFGSKHYIDLTLSDVTRITRTAAELEHKNKFLETENKKLEQVIFDLEQDAFALEREKLCRTAHDIWSQHLALAGLSLDLLLSRSKTDFSKDHLKEIERILESSSPAEAAQPICDLRLCLDRLSLLYQKLGVTVHIDGWVDFNDHEQEALCAMFKEAFANAVRHTYVRHIDLVFRENADMAGVTVRNACLDDDSGVVEGRGLYDIKNRIHQAGGIVAYQKDHFFELQASFPKKAPTEEGVSI